MEQHLRNIVDRLGGQEPVTISTIQQEGGRSENLSNFVAREEASAAEPRNLSTDHAESVPGGPLASICYQKLPHPLGQQIKDLPVVDGYHVDRLLEFLVGVFRLKQVGQWNVPMIYEILYPKCRGEILDLLIKAAQNKDSFDVFHAKVLEQMIPTPQQLQLRVLRYERVQAPSENLAQYVQSIREAAQILRIQESEEQVVQRICEGLNYVQRSRFVFQAPVKSFKDLDHLIVVDRRIAFAHANERNAVGLNHPEVVQVNVVTDRARPPQGSRTKAPTKEQRPVCYHCGKAGHFRRNCFAFRRGRFYRNQKGSRPRSLWGNKKIKGAATTVVSAVEVQLGKAHVQVLIDSGSVRSIISVKDFQRVHGQQEGPELKAVMIHCSSASGEDLGILGEADIKLKIQGFTWKWKFLVSTKLRGQPLLGMDFISQNKVVLDFGNRQCHFGFAPTVSIPLLKPKVGVWCAQTIVRGSEGGPEFRCGALNFQQRAQLESLVRKYPDVLTDKLGRTHVLEYDIQLLDKTPVRLAPYRLAPPKMKFLREHIQKLIKDDVIEPSCSHFSSPMFLVPKPGGSYRAVVDFRLLNKKIAIESVPLPDVHSAFHWFSKAKYFTICDLNQAYHQIPLSKASRPLTAFCTDWNLYEYKCVPFGLATGAQVLTRLLDKVFGDLKFNYVYHYLDDLVIYSENYQEHLEHVREVLNRLRGAGLTVKPEKVTFATKEISFLGHLVSPSGVRIDPERTRAIREFSPPKDVKAISRFIGMTNFYHKFIPDFAGIAAPLNKLRRKGEAFKWEKEQQEAFEALKKAIAQPPVLGMADFNRKFILQTDASGVALGAVLSQEIQGVRQPIAYASRALTAQERKASSIYELECLAVVFATDKFLKYLEHQEFILETDNQALSWLLSHPRQLGKIGRWVAKISALKFEVRHIRGTQNIIADALSRMFETTNEQENPSSITCNLAVTEFPLAFADVRQLQDQDPELADIKARLARGEGILNYVLSRGALYWRERRNRKLLIVVPEAAHKMLFSYFHESVVGGHLGVRKTIAKIREHFSWKGMSRQVKELVLACQVCACSKTAQNTRIGLLSSEVAEKPLQKIFIDYVGKFPRSKVGNKAILVCVDAFTKFVWLLPVREATSKATMRALKEHIFASFSVPETIVSDNAQCFISREFQDFCFGMGMRHVTTSPYYPQPSHAERFNKNLRAALIAYHSRSQDTWDTQLHWLQLAFNTAEHEATKAAPFAVMFPFRAGSPLLNKWKIHELLPERVNPRVLRGRWNNVRENLVRSKDIMARRYNQDRSPSRFVVGDLVYYKNHPISSAEKHIAAKLMPRFKGPYKIQEYLTPVTVRLSDPVTNRWITKTHVSFLKPCHAKG
jgi:transposase InsO family protein